MLPAPCTICVFSPWCKRAGRFNFSNLLVVKAHDGSSLRQFELMTGSRLGGRRLLSQSSDCRSPWATTKLSRHEEIPGNMRGAPRDTLSQNIKSFAYFPVYCSRGLVVIARRLRLPWLAGCIIGPVELSPGCSQITGQLGAHGQAESRR